MQKNIDLEAKVSISKDILFRELEGEAVLLHLKTGVYYGLNPMGTRIWHLLRKSGSLKAALKSLLAEYQVDTASCEKDLRNLASSLRENGLISIH